MPKGADILDYIFKKDINIPHWPMFNKTTWHMRKPSADNISNIKDIVALGYKTLINKLLGGDIDFDNEASMQMQFGSILKTIGELYQYKHMDKFHIELEGYFNLNQKTIKSKTNIARIDILMCLGEPYNYATCAIELKYFKSTNKREPNNRYDVFSDIHNLETYRKNNIDLAYFLIITDDKHYHSNDKYSKKTSDFDFRHGSKYEAGTILQYKTDKPYGTPISLHNSYNFEWKEYNTYRAKGSKHKDIYVMLLAIP